MAEQTKQELLPGKPEKLGATYDGKGVNFAVFSEMRRKWSFVCLMNRTMKRESN